MEDIKAGEYIRDCEGNIERIINVINGDLYIGDYGNSYPRNCITKHSFNIIDLIEFGDIIVYKKWEETYKKEVIDVGRKCVFVYKDVVYENEIKEIVTKEMFNSIKYEV